MMANLGLKLKVFFLMAVVITALSVANFLLFRDFIAKIDTQEGAKSIAALAESELKSKNYSLIANSFEILKGLKIEKGKVASKIATEKECAIVNDNGEVIGGNANVMTSYAGIPAVERALKDGLASDGMVSVDKDIYLIGVAPAALNGNMFAAITFEKFSGNLLSVFPMPVKAFKGSDPIAEKGSETWTSVEGSYGKAALDADLAAIVKGGGQKELNAWTRITAFAMPYDIAGGEKITIVTMTSMMPGWESYSKVIYSLVLYSVVAILVALFFTFIVTHEIDKILKNLASDISRMKVGEKLVLKKYSNGADIVVSAMNKLLQQYIEASEDVGSITSAPLVRGGKNSSSKGMEDFAAAVPDPFAATEAVDPFKVGTFSSDADIQKTEAPKIQREPEIKRETIQPEVNQTVPEQLEDDDDDDEKTQIAPSLGATVTSSVNPFDALWEDYCRIKRKHGESVSEKEKTNFIGKVRTNKASIMAKYKCSDVQFSVEEKDGKPVVKAKPVN